MKPPARHEGIVNTLSSIVNKAETQCKQLLPEHSPFDMLIAFPQCNFESGFKEMLCQKLSCFHWLSIPKNSKIIHCGIRFKIASDLWVLMNHVFSSHFNRRWANDVLECCYGHHVSYNWLLSVSAPFNVSNCQPYECLWYKHSLFCA